jgi:hypothetical protein
MKTSKTAPASKQYCVWADCIRRVYQDVEAASPEEAYRTARQRPDAWVFRIEHERNCYALSDEVTDLATWELLPVRGTPATPCKTCGSEIVETVNDSTFCDGECGPCEYERYQSQPILREHLRTLIELSSAVVGCRERGSLADAVRALDAAAQEAKAALAAYGEAA